MQTTFRIDTHQTATFQDLAASTNMIEYAGIAGKHFFFALFEMAVVMQVEHCVQL
jgi:hypothetical protein